MKQCCIGHKTSLLDLYTQQLHVQGNVRKPIVMLTQAPALTRPRDMTAPQAVTTAHHMAVAGATAAKEVAGAGVDTEAAVGEVAGAGGVKKVGTISSRGMGVVAEVGVTKIKGSAVVAEVGVTRTKGSETGTGELLYYLHYHVHAIP